MLGFRNFAHLLSVLRTMLSLPSELQNLIDDKYIAIRRHPEAELYILNYTAKTQYAAYWNHWTKTCRGLILDAQGMVTARPFHKFFNLDEHAPEEIPNEPFEVFEKIDGSLGILYWIEDKPFIASRGSFDSEQALRANEILHRKYPHTFSALHRGRTYLFEIIYPENRIVVDYGGRRELVLLSILDTGTGQEYPLEDIGFPMARRYDGLRDLAQLHRQTMDNAEGYVVRFQNGFRVKVKFEEYLRLHRLVTRVSNVTIWQHLAEKRPFDELLEQVPDEYYQWLHDIRAALLADFAAVEQECRAVFRVLDTRRETAAYFLQQRYPTVLFQMLDGKDYAPSVWKIIRPEIVRGYGKEE